jgi:hypothetical protein
MVFPIIRSSDNSSRVLACRLANNIQNFQSVSFFIRYNILFEINMDNTNTQKQENSLYIFPENKNIFKSL